MPPTLRFLCAIALALQCSWGYPQGPWMGGGFVPQTTLGEVLDGGAKRLTAEEFRRELVGPYVSGVMPSGARLELVYLDGGALRGAGMVAPGGPTSGGASYYVEGAWNIDDLERICVSMRMGAVVLPPRCQFWFRYEQAYYVSDSDSDRSVKVLRRTVAR